MAGRETFRSDGNAVDVVAPKDVEKGDTLRAQGFQGVVMKDAESGETVAIETAQREHALNVEGLTATKGTVLYVDSDGDLTNTSSGNYAFGIVSRAKDDNDIAWVVMLPQPRAAS